MSRATTLAQQGRLVEAAALLAQDVARVCPACRGAPAEAGSRLWVAQRVGRTVAPNEILAFLWPLMQGPLSDEALFLAGRQLESESSSGLARLAYGAVTMASPYYLRARRRLFRMLMAEGRVSLALSAIEPLFWMGLPRRARLRSFVDASQAFEAQGLDEEARSLRIASCIQGRKVTADCSQALTKAESLVLQGIVKILRGARPRWFRRTRVRGLYWLALGRYRMRRGGCKRALEPLKKVASMAESRLIRSFGLYYLGICLARTGEKERGVQTLLQSARAFGPQSPLGARALYEAASAMVARADFASARQLYEHVAVDYPFSGLARRSSWRAVVLAMVVGRFQEAQDRIAGLLERLDYRGGVPPPDVRKLWYFLAVARLESGRRDEARRLLGPLAAGYPFSYYAVLARTRLGDDAPSLDYGGSELQPTQLPDKALDAGIVCPAQGGAGSYLVALFALGMSRLARAKARALASVGALSVSDLPVALALMADGTRGRQALSIARYLWGKPGNYQASLLTHLFPAPCLPLAQWAGDRTGVDPYLLCGVMRAESAFDPKARSSAGAVGLMQLMPKTARTVARRILGRKWAPYWRPKTNTLLGSLLLRELLRHFSGSTPLAILGYLAGSGAARRAWRTFGDATVDLLVEAVPEPGASSYIKKVVTYWAGYRHLYGPKDTGPIQVSLKLPQELGPFLEPSSGTPGS